MLAVGLRFLAGRYHANPPGRHVNEGDIEWPPAPWRFTRALISTWYQKVDHQIFPYERLESLVDTLSEAPPVYRLPGAVHSHTRHYMPQGKLNKGRERTSLVFDAFARIDKDDELIIAWPSLELDEDSLLLLEGVLGKLGYLGRAESWVEARILSSEEIPDRFNCIESTGAVDTETGEVRGETVQVLSPKPGPQYRSWQQQFVATEVSGRKGKQKKLLLRSVPDSLTQALSLDSADLQQAGWSQPPAGQIVSYLRPVDCLRPVPGIPRSREAQATTARFMLVGRPLPRIEDSIRVGEWLRAALMGKAKWVLNGADRIPPEISGHGLGDANRHGHAFFLPEDADGDGYIDHLLVHAPAGLSNDAQRILGRLNLLRGKQGMEWQVVLESLGNIPSFGDDCDYIADSQTWQSITPYLRPWHLKKNRSVETQIAAFIRKECRLRKLPEPASVEILKSIHVHGKPRHAIHFHRFRNKHGLTQPDTLGSFLRLGFSEKIVGPMALGFGCHFGLGLFRPLD